MSHSTKRNGSSRQQIAKQRRAKVVHQPTSPLQAMREAFEQLDVVLEKAGDLGREIDLVDPLRHDFDALVDDVLELKEAMVAIVAAFRNAEGAAPKPPPPTHEVH